VTAARTSSGDRATAKHWKNVAGYDLSRLMCGSYGCLGVLTEASIKVLPTPQRRLTLRTAIDADEALSRLIRWASEPWPISGAAHDGTALIVRLEGGHGSVDASEARLRGQVVEDNSFWQRLRDLQLQRLAGTVEAILRRLGFPLTAVADAHLCCGSAGTYSITHLYQHPRQMS